MVALNERAVLRLVVLGLCGSTVAGCGEDASSSTGDGASSVAPAGADSNTPTVIIPVPSTEGSSAMSPTPGPTAAGTNTSPVAAPGATTTGDGPSMSMTMDPSMMDDASMPEATPPADGESTGDVMMEAPQEPAPDEEMTPPTGEPGTPVGDSSNVGDCPPAPADAPPEAVEALRIVTEARLAAGAGCITMISELNLAAKAHCDYYAANSGNCTADPHSEVEGCDGFSGSDPGARAQAAGYDGRFSFEVMAFANDPQRSIDMWINSVWHRIPILDPWVTEMGYGAADGCDTIDFGRGTPAPDDVVVVYPYVDQIDVPTTFHGDREGPEPPMPPTGWPSGLPVNIYAQDLQISEHVLTIDGDETPIEHMWLTPEDESLLRDEVFLYSHTPLEAMTTYRVRLVGTYVGGDLNLDWTFTTGEAEPVRGGFGGN